MAEKANQRPVELGDPVRDRLTGFEGICGGITELLYGCRRIHIEPKHLDKDGKLPEVMVFDEPRVEITKGKNFLEIAPPGRDPGGPVTRSELNDRRRIRV